MDCNQCGSGAVPFVVPAAYEPHVPGSESAVAICSRCLELQPAPDPKGTPDFERISGTFPTNPEAAVPLALLLGLLENLALYRDEITELLVAVERAGTDPLLALDRLAADPEVETEIDLSGRRRQLEQLL